MSVKLEPGRTLYEEVLRAFPDDPWESWETLTEIGKAGWARAEKETIVKYLEYQI